MRTKRPVSAVAADVLVATLAAVPAAATRRDIWLNEGFATHAEWLWSERLGEGAPQQIFDFLYGQPLSAPYWDPPPGDPGTDELFDDSVYVRGALTVHALRMTVGDEAFWRVVESWVAENRVRTGSTGSSRWPSGSRVGAPAAHRR